jgi:hypothetical protein
MQHDYTRQTRRSYADSRGQVASLMDSQVVWEPYTAAAMAGRAPQDLS